MIIGMLWFDNSKEELNKKVTIAVAYYEKKYKRSPDTCLVNSKMLEKEFQVDKVNVRPYKYILLHHFWLGIEEKETL